MDGQRGTNRTNRAARREVKAGGKEVPIVRNEDVEFSMEAADQEDLEALERMKAADRRQSGGKE